MKIIRDDERRLEIVQHDFLLGIWFAVFGCVVCFAGYSKFIGRNDIGGLEALGPGGGLAVMVFGAVLSVAGLGMCKRVRLVFDRTQQNVSWSRTSLFGTKNRTVLFSQVGRPSIQYHPMKGPEWGRESASRLVLELDHGSLPFSDAYAVNSTKVWERAVKAIDDFIDRKP